MALSVIEHKDNIIQDLKEKLQLYDKDTILPDEKWYDVSPEWSQYPYHSNGDTTNLESHKQSFELCNQLRNISENDEFDIVWNNTQNVVHEQKEVKPYMLNHQKHNNNSFKSAGIKTNNIALNKQLESLKNSLKINKRNKEIEDFVDFSDPVKSIEQKIKEENTDTALSSLKKVNIKKKRSKKSLQELTTDVNEPASKRSKPKETNLADQKEIAVKNNKKLNISAANGWVTKPSKKSKNGSKKPEDAFAILESSNNIDDSSYDPIEEKVKKKEKKKKCAKNASKKPKRNKSKPDSKSPPPSQLCGQKSSQNSNSNSNKNSQSYISLTDHNPNHNKPSNQNPNHKSDKSKHLPLTNPQDNTIKIREAAGRTRSERLK